jgi:hypothetical protein
MPATSRQMTVESMQCNVMGFRVVMFERNPNPNVKFRNTNTFHFGGRWRESRLAGIFVYSAEALDLRSNP